MAISPLSFDKQGIIEDSSVLFGDQDQAPLTEPPLFDTPNALISPAPVDLTVPTECVFSTPLPWVRSETDTPYTNPSTENQDSPLGGGFKLRPLAGSRKYAHSLSPSPEPQSSRQNQDSDGDGDGDGDYGWPESPTNERQRPVKKTAHNMIEKRYRTNLNDKIAALRDSVPSLRATTKNSRGEDVLQEDLHGLTPPHKLNKVRGLALHTDMLPADISPLS